MWNVKKSKSYALSMAREGETSAKSRCRILLVHPTWCLLFICFSHTLTSLVWQTRVCTSLLLPHPIPTSSWAATHLCDVDGEPRLHSRDHGVQALGVPEMLRRRRHVLHECTHTQNSRANNMTLLEVRNKSPSVFTFICLERSAARIKACRRSNRKSTCCWAVGHKEKVMSSAGGDTVFRKLQTCGRLCVKGNNDNFVAHTLLDCCCCT